MMGKTHIAVGIASGIAAAQPDTLGECLSAVMGGAVGGLLCDVDVRAQNNRDARIARFVTICIALGILIADWVLKTGIWRYLLAHAGAPLAIGAAGFLGICIAGSFTSHRSFMHSLLALVLLSVCLSMVYPPLVPAFAAGFASHLLLDLLNRKPILLLFPWKKGCCLNLFYADGAANALFLLLGCAASVLLLFLFL